MDIDEDKVKSLIWKFRSSVNNHGFDVDADNESHSKNQLEQLKEKEALLKEWKILCPFVDEYCNAKCIAISRKLHHSDNS